MPTRQAKHWCFTINNYDQSTIERLRDASLEPECKYIIFGKERGERTETEHLQGFISFTKRKSLGPTKTFLGGKAHLEPARGTPAQAAEYCKKEGDFEEFGELPQGQGARNDLVEVAEKVKEGKRMRDVAEEHPAAFLRYGSGMCRLRQFYRPERTTAPTIWTFWGKTGTGKTRRVWEFADIDTLWVHPGDRWFDGYDGHQAVLFDDFDGGWFKLTYLLKLLDRYVFQVPVKGGYVWWCPTTIYITTNIDPQLWYPNANDDHRSALHRRLTEFGTIQHCE